MSSCGFRRRSLSLSPFTGYRLKLNWLRWPAVSDPPSSDTAPISRRNCSVLAKCRWANLRRDMGRPIGPFPAISFDPTGADFWDAFNLDPAVHNATNTLPRRFTDFRLNTNEFAAFRTNGFVVSPRLGSYSFADSYYKIFNDDLPVFISADAVLHAWHRSFVSMLEEIEETYFAQTLQLIIQGMAQQVPLLSSQSGGTALADGVLDVDYFLAVAQSLVSGINSYGSLGQTTRVQDTLAAITNLQPASAPLFGTNRVVDFSQFQVRGHYTTSQLLQRYFRTMMWCSLADFRFTGSTNDNSLRELSGAIAMNFLMQRSGQFTNWSNMDRAVQMFVGLSDSMNFAQLNDLCVAGAVSSPADLPNRAALQTFQNRIMSGQIGAQDIRSGYFYSPFTREQIKLPRSFTVMGQRFVVDSWAMSKCTFDDVIWDTNGIPGVEDKILRRVPSALDVAFSVFGNDQIVPELASRIADQNGHPWRDGLQYQHNLAAVRNVLDRQNEGAWTNDVYGCWLACLRELSIPTTSANYPEAIRTRNWAMKTLNTQLASWTELRHDTVLYAKQPYSGNIGCSYPDGFVEPRVSFWSRVKEMALRARAVAATLPNSGFVVLEPNPYAGGSPGLISLVSIYTNRLQFFDTFADHMITLRDISQKELDRAPLSSNETYVIRNFIENMTFYSGHVRRYNGWYPSLYYVNVRTSVSFALSQSDQWDALVTDVHTDPQDAGVGDPGSILHEGVGNIHLLMVAVDWGAGDACVYAGPVLSHYEFGLGPTTRKTDEQWKADIRASLLPQQPVWTRGYLVPSVDPQAPILRPVSDDDAESISVIRP